MQCPKCSADYLREDCFCMSCGEDLRKKTEDGGILLKRNDLAGIAGSHVYTVLSPLAPYYEGPTEPIPVNVEPSVLQAILEPERAVFLMEFTRDSFQQDVLLIRNSSYYHWEENASEVSISGRANPREFLGMVKNRLARCIATERTSLMSIKKKSMRTLAAATTLCRALSTIDRAASFVTMSHLKSFTGVAEGILEDLKDLSREGFVRCIGDADPLVVLEEKGEDLFLLLNEYDKYFIVQILADRSQDYPSLNFAARKGSLYLITSPKGSDDLVIRSLDAGGMNSLINWAWTTAISVQ